MVTIEDLLNEALHTYQLMIECSCVVGDNVNLTAFALKWPDIAQSAIKYAQALENKNPLETRETEEIKNCRKTLKDDLVVITTVPIESIYNATKERATKLLGKEPKLSAMISMEERYKFPIQYKNKLIEAINNLFKTLEVMTGMNYPALNKRK